MAGLPPGLEVPPGYEDVEPSLQPLNGASSAWDQGQQTGSQLEDAAEEDIKVGVATVHQSKAVLMRCTWHAMTLQTMYCGKNLQDNAC